MYVCVCVKFAISILSPFIHFIFQVAKEGDLVSLEAFHSAGRELGVMARTLLPRVDEVFFFC